MSDFSLEIGRVEESPEEIKEYEEYQKRKHTGLFYRVSISNYYSQSTGEFHKKLNLRPLKRKSCKGCPTCDHIEEMISESGCEELLEGDWKHGEEVELKFWIDKHWTDYGYEYDSGLEWVNVTKSDTSQEPSNE